MAYTIEIAKACRKHNNTNIGQRILIVGEDFTFSTRWRSSETLVEASLPADDQRCRPSDIAADHGGLDNPCVFKFLQAFFG